MSIDSPSLGVLRPAAGAHGRVAQVGIGTLILFIAVALVATMTVGLFFDVAGVLESDSEATTADTTDQLTGRLEVVAVSGTVRGGEIERVNITVGVGASGAVDLRETTLQWIGPHGSEALSWAGSGADGPTFGITTIRDDDGSGPVLNDDVDRAVLTVDTGFDTEETTVVDGQTVALGTTGPALDPGESARVQLVADTTTGYRLQVPVAVENTTRVGL